MTDWSGYHFGEAWGKAFAFLGSLPSDAAEGRYEIDGDRIFAMVMSYETRQPKDAVLEAHRRYVDIQAVLIGSEGCEWFPVQGLVTGVPYSDEKDAEFFQRPNAGPVRIAISPGLFVAFFPRDAHMPGLVMDGNPQQIKKVVVKISVDLLPV